MGRGDFLRSHLRGEAPPKHDGRNVDPRLGKLEGEGALQEVEHLGAEHPYPALPDRNESTYDGASYYGLPVLKEHVWKAAIPAYFYVGGLAGASAVLGAAAQWSQNPFLRGLVERTRIIAAGGAVLSGALLIEDLGRPSRFLNMLRVFRPTSPMSVGSWVLAAFGGFATIAAVLRKQRFGPLATVGDVAALGAGVLGLPLAGYTAVLLANTAVPVWQGPAASLPPLFMASAVTSAASALELCELNPFEARVVRRFGLAGKAAELFFSKAVERAASQPEIVGAPLRRGLSGALWKSAEVLVAASLLASALSVRSRPLRRASGWLGTLGTIALRFGILQAGRMSARDPHATFARQRGTTTPRATDRVRVDATRPSIAQADAGPTSLR
ncbi:MAG TPA: NrfD/PsrC family molybdoenzyme membrane anchor subunit [Myxococcales bacterium]|nr:NrfD/PsrC family molybdoenzyme membrane anchor subunit [Myxococcales bacterium]